MDIDRETLHHCEVLWDYHHVVQRLERSDFILALGSNDLCVAEHASQLFLSGYSALLVVSGGHGKITRGTLVKTEAELFKGVAIETGVPDDKILTEERATNTGENFILTKALLDKHQIDVKKGIIVTKPYMCRRALATGMKQWPNVFWTVSSSSTPFLEYVATNNLLEQTVNLMVGDLQRIEIYAKRGFQVSQDIPETVWQSYRFLVRKGYDKFVLDT